MGSGGSSSSNQQAESIDEKKACQIAINTLPSRSTEVRARLAEDHRHTRRSKCNKASLLGIEAESHQPGWRICGFCRKLRFDFWYYLPVVKILVSFLPSLNAVVGSRDLREKMIGKPFVKKTYRYEIKRSKS